MTKIRKEHDEVSLSAIRPLPAGGGDYQRTVDVRSRVVARSTFARA